MKKIFFALLFILPLQLFSQLTTTQVTAGISEDGIRYYLPKTELNIIVKAIKTTHYKGELANYTSLLLRDNSANTADQVTWSLSSVDFQPYGIPDNTKCYNIYYKNKNNTPEIVISNDGLLLSVNYEAKNPPLLVPESHKVILDEGENKENYRSQAMRNCNSLYKIAQVAADELFDLRESRMALVKGDADFMPKDGKQLQLMLQQLSDKEKEILRLFYGYQKQEEITFTFSYAINPINIEDHILFRFSTHYGVVPADDLSGYPIFISLKKLQSNTANKVPSENKKDNKSLFYNVPSLMNVQIYNDKKLYKQENIPVAQAGHVEYLGSELFGKKVFTQLQLSPITGSLLYIHSSEKR